MQQEIPAYLYKSRLHGPVLTDLLSSMKLSLLMVKGAAPNYDEQGYLSMTFQPGEVVELTTIIRPGELWVSVLKREGGPPSTILPASNLSYCRNSTAYLIWALHVGDWALMLAGHGGHTCICIGVESSRSRYVSYRACLTMNVRILCAANCQLLLMSGSRLHSSCCRDQAI